MNAYESWLKYFITEELFLVNDKTEDKHDDRMHTDNKQKSLLVLLRADHTGNLSEENAVFLQKVLKAVNLSENDYLHVYLPDHQHDVPREILRSSPRKVIIFDSTLRPPGLPESKYKVQDYEGIQWLTADKLDEISGDVKKKKALWSALKELFDLG